MGHVEENEPTWPVLIRGPSSSPSVPLSPPTYPSCCVTKQPDDPSTHFSPVTWRGSLEPREAEWWGTPLSIPSSKRTGRGDSCHLRRITS